MKSRLARDLAEATGLGLADWALWQVYRPLGLFALGAILVALAAGWEP